MVSSLDENQNKIFYCLEFEVIPYMLHEDFFTKRKAGWGIDVNVNARLMIGLLVTVDKEK